MDRRKFLETMAKGAAWVSVLGPAVIRERLDLGKKSYASTGDRSVRIFVSDLHLNVDAPYSWLRGNVDPLARFLNLLKAREDVAELVILGDFLDDWVVPAEECPKNLAEILEAGMNEPVVSALQELCENSPIAVTYVTGNHDLLSFESSAKETILGYFPHMTIISNEPGLGAYALDYGLWAEHGHRYALFNAPDVWSRAGGHLPLGYFISRLSASQSVASGQKLTSPEILQKALESSKKRLPPTGEKLISAVFWTVAAWAGKRPWDRFVMNGVDGWGEDPTLAEVDSLYQDIYHEWSKRQDIVPPGMALADEFTLEGAALLLLRMPNFIQHQYPFTPQIVIFGHTHKAVLRKDFGPTRGVYANTGTWIDGHAMTWVEVLETGGGSVEVSLSFFSDSAAHVLVSETMPVQGT